MDIIVRNKSFVKISAIDTVDSVIWVSRYSDFGDFELYTPITQELLSSLQEDFYLSIDESDTIMIIESIQIKTDLENGNKLLVKGRSLESILDRRIVQAQTIIDGSLTDGIGRLLTENAINASQPQRNIPGLIYNTILDPNSLKAQFDGEYLSDIILYLADLNQVGFKITLNDSNQFVSTLYYGKDRSYDQTENGFVVFSPTFENLLSSDYFQSNMYRKTYALIFGDPTSGPAHRVEVLATNDTGLERRELLVNASDLSKFVQGSSTEIPIPEYLDQLRERGRQELRQNRSIVRFEGSVDVNSRDFKYGRDFFLGDIVQFENEYGLKGKARITEFTISENLNGRSEYPTFEMV